VTVEETLAGLHTSALAQLEQASTLDAIEAVRVETLGRKGRINDVSKEMGKLPPEEKARIGKLLNETKRDLEVRIDARKNALELAALEARLNAEWIDLTEPAPGVRPGSLHPVTIIQKELEQLFTSLGFAVLDGPEVELEEYNFDKLNIPPHHPARDMQDTFWLKADPGEKSRVLRTHTSPVQLRGLETLKPPLKMIAPGRVFRNEEVDASHEHTFYQLEGMMVDREVSVAHLIYFMKTFLSEVFHRDVTVRLRPGFFPFVEPGFELDIRCLICGGKGCAVCKRSGWVELCPCGLVHPEVLRAGGADPEIWNGFAFGLGLTRLAMMRYAVDDIRLFMSGDLRFLTQFRQ